MWVTGNGVAVTFRTCPDARDLLLGVHSRALSEMPQGGSVTQCGASRGGKEEDAGDGP